MYHNTNQYLPSPTPKLKPNTSIHTHTMTSRKSHTSQSRTELCNFFKDMAFCSFLQANRTMYSQASYFFSEKYPASRAEVLEEISGTFDITVMKSINDYVILWLSELKRI